MPSNDLIEALAKVVIAAAWADGDLSSEEIESVKDLLFRYSSYFRDAANVSTIDRAWLDMYLESPVTSAERDGYINELQAALLSTEDKKFAISALEDMVQADGEVTEPKQAVLAEARAAIEAADVGLFTHMGKLVWSATGRRSKVVLSGPDRGKYYEEYLTNKVYYGVRHRLDLGEGVELDIPDAELRKLSGAGGMMAKVAEVDRDVTEVEFEVMMESLLAHWDISRDAAAFVAEVAVSEVTPDLDEVRFTREFVYLTTAGERARFLNILFSIADADGFVTEDELTEIRHIAHKLMLNDGAIREAKRKIPKERRAA